MNSASAKKSTKKSTKKPTKKPTKNYHITDCEFCNKTFKNVNLHILKTHKMIKCMNCDEYKESQYAGCYYAMDRDDVKTSDYLCYECAREAGYDFTNGGFLCHSEEATKRQLKETDPIIDEDEKLIIKYLKRMYERKEQLIEHLNNDIINRKDKFLNEEIYNKRFNSVNAQIEDCQKDIQQIADGTFDIEPYKKAQKEAGLI